MSLWPPWVAEISLLARRMTQPTESCLFSDFKNLSGNDSAAHNMEMNSKCVYVCPILFVQYVSRPASLTLDIKGVRGHRECLEHHCSLGPRE